MLRQNQGLTRLWYKIGWQSTLNTITVILISVPVLGYLTWLSITRARESAVAAARRVCRDCGVQFLDQTVALQQSRLVRAATGSLAWRRLYQFEFSEEGVERCPGQVTVVGGRAMEVVLDGGRVGRLIVN